MGLSASILDTLKLDPPECPHCGTQMWLAQITPAKPDHDERMFEWVRKFNAYDLYSKGRERPKIQEILPYYEELVSEFFPDKIDW